MANLETNGAAIRYEKKKLEKQLKELLKSFEESTGCYIASVQLGRYSSIAKDNVIHNVEMEVFV